MMREAASIAARLEALGRGVRALADARAPPDEQRYLRASAELIGREALKLDRAAASGDDEIVAWGLRSLSGMMKGLIDIGADLPRLAPELWAEAGAMAEDAYAAQEPSRGS